MSEGSSSQESPLKSDMGITTVSNAVVSQVAGIAAQEVEKVQMGGGANFSKGVTVEVGEEETAIDLTMAVEYGQSIPRITDAVRRNVTNRVENLVGLRVNEVNITVSNIFFPQQEAEQERQRQLEQQRREQEAQEQQRVQ